MPRQAVTIESLPQALEVGRQHPCFASSPDPDFQSVSGSPALALQGAAVAGKPRRSRKQRYDHQPFLVAQIAFIST